MTTDEHTEPILLLPEDPHAPVTVAAGELFEWGWLLDGLAGWLDQLDQRGPGTDRHYQMHTLLDPLMPQRLPDLLDTLAELHQRIGALLDTAGSRR